MLLAAEVAARPDDPRQVAGLVARALACGGGHPSGVALEGYGPTVAAIEHGDLTPALTALLHGGNATFIFAGDFEPADLLKKLEARFGGWQAARDAGGAPAAPVTAPPPGRLVLVDRPGAAQTMIYLMRPVPAPKDDGRARRGVLRRDALRPLLHQPLEPESAREAQLHLWRRLPPLRGGRSAPAARQRRRAHARHGAALQEFKREFDGLAKGDVTAEELTKARETVRANLVSSLETTRGTADELVEEYADHRPGRRRGARPRGARPGRARGRERLRPPGLLRLEGPADRAGRRPRADPAQLAAAGFGAPLAADADGRLAN
jgi:hypothetical protein